MHQVINIDTTGLDALQALHAALLRRGGRLILAALNEQPLSLLRRSGMLDDLGPQNITASLETAIREAGSRASAEG